MNKYLKSYLHRGAIFGGLGPIIASIIYLILAETIDEFSLTGVQVFLAIISTYFLAFIQAGSSVFNQIEHWSLLKSLVLHLASIYFAYLFCYLINSWIPFSWIIIASFTGIFIIIYFIIWFVVYFSIKVITKKLNNSLS